MINVTALEVDTLTERTADHERLHAALDSAETCYAVARRLVFDVPRELQATRPLTFLQRQSLVRLQAAEEWLRQVREQSQENVGPRSISAGAETASQAPSGGRPGR